MNNETDNALDELLLVRPVSEDDIVQAYRRMAKRFHPDKAIDPDEKEWVQKKFLRIQQAYESLRGLPIEAINAQEEATLQNSEPEKCQERESTKQEEPWSVVPTALGVFVGLPIAMVVLSCLGATFLRTTVPKRASGTSTKTVAIGKSQASGTPRKAVSIVKSEEHSSPSDRLVGRWRNIDDGSEVIYSPIDPSLHIGAYRLRNKSMGGKVGPPIRFKVMSEDRTGTTFIMREFNEDLERLGLITGLNTHMSDITCTISSDGRRMTREFIFGRSRVFSVYQHIDNPYKSGTQKDSPKKRAPKADPNSPPAIIIHGFAIEDNSSFVAFTNRGDLHVGDYIGAFKVTCIGINQFVVEKDGKSYVYEMK